MSSVSDSSSSSDCSFDALENEPLYAVLSQFLVADESNKNIATVLADIASELKAIRLALQTKNESRGRGAGHNVESSIFISNANSD